MTWVCYAWVEHIHRDVICAFAVHWVAVYFYCKFFVWEIELSCSDAVWDKSRIYFFIFADWIQLHLEIVYMWLTETIRPPKFRLQYLNINIGSISRQILSTQLFSTLFLNNNIIILNISMLRLLELNSKIDNNPLLTNNSIASPNIIKPYLLPYHNLNIPPYAHSHQLRCPIPRILITSFTSMCVFEWHVVFLLALGIVFLGGFDIYLEQILLLFT